MPARRRKGAGRPLGAVSEETRARIVDAACRRFAEQGYAKTSNQDIARAAGVTTGALYHYFGSKAELFAAVHRRVQGVLLDVYRDAFAREKTCVAQLCAGLETAVTVSREHPGMSEFAAIAPVEIQRHRELGEILEADVEGVRSFFTHLVQEASRRGEIATGVDTEAVVNVVIATFFGLAWLRAHVARDEEHEAALRAFQRLIRATLFQTM
jgi:AcrR family transcriptional regulator